MNSKALSSSGSRDKEGKYMVESASDHLRTSTKKQQKAKMNRFEVNDHYNPEGQHRNYERNLKSVHHANNNKNNDDTTFDVSDPTHMYTGMNDTHSSGAKRLSQEMKRRMEKSKQTQLKKRQLEFESTDINYVDKRNKHFNEKISRTYDNYTAEIRQNLERGTAL